MHKLPKKLNSLLVVCSLLLMSCGGGSQEKTAYVNTEIKSSLKETLDNYLEANFEENEPGMAILVASEGNVVYKRGLGSANLNESIAITADTGFRLASISKSLTAVAIMMLYEQGLLAPEDSILTYLPEFSPTWRDMTIHHLLSHQSGITDYDNGNLEDGITNQKVLDYYVNNTQLDFQPGTDKAYGNASYHLLAEIVERITGLSYEDYMQAYIFSPLNMVNTYVIDESMQPRMNDALNFGTSSKLFDKDIYINGANGIVSSLNGMWLFTQGLMSNALITSETFSLMRQRHSEHLFNVNHYGYGFIVLSDSSEVIFHPGRFDGFVTYLYLDLHKNQQIVLLGNGGDSTNNHEYLFNLIMDALNE